ncbi:hypothetical protein GN958_ATG12886 [Phytophthora infestans]|uniref:Uncharacterized protein n=1 Tax=Phytophthora infestans TaxID=4787 RepID=A0A8S9UBR7_PHYIN|nr:hypothetical protein GN958_ATG12886 [Phytophthora infestans]
MFKVGGNLGLRLDIAQQRRELGEAVHLEVRERPLKFVVNEVEELQIGERQLVAKDVNLPATIFSSAAKYLGTISSTNTFFFWAFSVSSDVFSMKSTMGPSRSSSEHENTSTFRASVASLGYKPAILAA